MQKSEVNIINSLAAGRVQYKTHITIIECIKYVENVNIVIFTEIYLNP